ncbi:MAG: hypothetical protein ACR2GX_03090 [Candidatus Dormibacteria bacterium]
MGGKLSNVHLKVDCFHLDSAARALSNGVSTPIASVRVQATQASSIGDPFDAPYNAAISAMAADLNTLLTRVDALGTAVSNASEAYQGVDLALAKRLAHHRGVA